MIADSVESAMPASMGPRPFSRGNCPIPNEDGLHVGEGFNGATTFQPWKLDGYINRIKNNITLQWGHDLSAVETIQMLDPL